MAPYEEVHASVKCSSLLPSGKSKGGGADTCNTVLTGRIRGACWIDFRSESPEAVGETITPTYISTARSSESITCLLAALRGGLLGGRRCGRPLGGGSLVCCVRLGVLPARLTAPRGATAVMAPATTVARGRTTPSTRAGGFAILGNTLACQSQWSTMRCRVSTLSLIHI